MACEKLLEYLDEHGIRYERINHPQAYSAQETADRARIPGREFAKTVMIKLDGRMAMAVLPAPEKVNFTLLQQAARAETISLATEPDFHEMFPDCDLGAMPPFGNVYDLDVYVSGSMSDAQRIAFPAGTHTELLRMSYADFERLVQPRTARFTFLQQAEMEAEA
ncbi:YbaK/EbsC family protein [bacterium]|nr:YbaK/EbsC family protein [bacterium]MBU1676764.1 YbaK/EbsC family protein [bacterium]